MLNLIWAVLPIDHLRGFLEPVKPILLTMFDESLLENGQLPVRLDAAETLLGWV